LAALLRTCGWDAESCFLLFVLPLPTPVLCIISAQLCGERVVKRACQSLSLSLSSARRKLRALRAFPLFQKIVGRACFHGAALEMSAAARTYLIQLVAVGARARRGMQIESSMALSAREIRKLSTRYKK
jgi:hypothetical protein